MNKKLNIELLSLVFHNFKGIGSLVVNFSNKTTIRGKNRSGKSTIGDGPIWLLSGKDLNNRTNHEIRPRGIDGKVAKGLETTVEGTFLVGENKITFKRIYRDKMVQKKGEM
ncbi:MAG: AAA family ATPase, partial [Clostridium sp.]